MIEIDKVETETKDKVIIIDPEKEFTAFVKPNLLSCLSDRKSFKNPINIINYNKELDNA